MHIYQLFFHIQLAKDLSYYESIDFLSKNVNRIIFESLLLRTLHESKQPKPYVVGSLGATGKDRLYHKATPYTLTIRTIDEGVAKEFIEASKKAKLQDILIEKAHYKKFHIGPIDKLYTITPAVLTVEKNRYWTPEDDLMLLVRNLKNNLLKKYRIFFKNDIILRDELIEFFKVENKIPIAFKYKDGKILANRFTLGFAKDPASQKLAKLAFGVGVLEKNSLGFGMVIRGK